MELQVTQPCPLSPVSPNQGTWSPHGKLISQELGGHVAIVMFSHVGLPRSPCPGRTTPPTPPGLALTARAVLP